jgi:hypothetical protein
MITREELIRRKALLHTMPRGGLERGGQVVIRRVSRLGGPDPQVNPPRFEAAVIDGSHSAGQGTVSIRCGSARGRLIAGDRIQPQGYPGELVVAAEAMATGNSFSAVVLTEPLAAPLADGAAVGFRWTADVAVPAVVSSFPTRLLDNDKILVGDMMISVPAAALDIEPKVTDLVIFQGRTLGIVRSSPSIVQNRVVFHNIHARTHG